MVKRKFQLFDLILDIIFAVMPPLLIAFPFYCECSYLQEPKNGILSNLEESVRAKDSELKSVKVAIENLEKTKANIVKEIQELQKSI